MIPPIILLTLGYAFWYAGLSTLSGGVLTGGNKQGLLSSLGFGKLAASTWSPAAMFTTPTQTSGTTGGVSFAPTGTGGNVQAATNLTPNGGAVSPLAGARQAPIGGNIVAGGGVVKQA